MPTWLLECDDNFTNAPATGSRAATYPTSVGSGANSTTGVGNGWIDREGDIYKLPSSGVLNNTCPTTSDFHSLLVRPTSENYSGNSDSRVVYYTVPAVANNNNPIWCGALRVQPNTSDQFYAFLLGGGFGGVIFAINGGSGTQLHGTGMSSYDATHAYSVDFRQ